MTAHSLELSRPSLRISSAHTHTTQQQQGHTQHCYRQPLSSCTGELEEVGETAVVEEGRVGVPDRCTVLKRKRPVDRLRTQQEGSF